MQNINNVIGFSIFVIYIEIVGKCVLNAKT